MYPLRSITFLAELVFPPQRHTVDQLQQVHHRTFQTASGGHGGARYANFQVLPSGAQLGNPPPRPGAVSQALILPDRVRIQEHHTGMSREDFERRVLVLAQAVLEELAVAHLTAEQFLVQSLVNPKSEPTSIQFMAQRVLQQGANLLGMQPEPALLGLRLQFPATDQREGQFLVRVENFHQDPRSLFLECAGLFRRPVPLAGLEGLGDLFRDTVRFLEGPVIDLVARADTGGPVR